MRAAATHSDQVSRTLRHTFRIIRFLRSKMAFEKTFLREYEPLKNHCRGYARKIEEEFSIDTYDTLFSDLFETGRRACISEHRHTDADDDVSQGSQEET
ncbi:MAG: hypothetical protein MZV63_61065 [Marinilabiliales bacterium]|nr:hypothetical protein [Marinilabiliales bacterium]